MSYEQIVLALGALGFAGFGILLLIKPALMSAVNISAADPNARAEIRATYGGLELGIGFFLLLCITNGDWIWPGLFFQFFALGGMGVARTLAIIIERFQVSRMIRAFALLELVLAFLTFLALT